MPAKLGLGSGSQQSWVLDPLCAAALVECGEKTGEPSPPAENTAKKQRRRPFRPAERQARGDRGNVFLAQVRERKNSRKICQSQKFALRYNGGFGPRKIGKLLDVEGFSLFPRERQ